MTTSRRVAVAGRQRQDHDDVDADGRAAGLRGRPVLRRRRRAGQARHQRPPRHRRRVRRRGGRERRLLPGLPARGRASSPTSSPTTSTSTAPSRPCRTPTPVRALRPPRRPAGDLRRRRGVACPGGAGPRRRPRVLTYGFAPTPTSSWRRAASGMTSWAGLRSATQGTSAPAADRRSPGRHNLLNADSGVHWPATAGLGQDPDRLLEGLFGFTGTRRRFEPKGEVERACASSTTTPTTPARSPRSSGTGAELVRGQGRLVVVFQPHLYSRTRDFAREFAAALAPADIVVLMDVYAAREDPVPGVSSALIERAIRRVPPRGGRRGDLVVVGRGRGDCPPRPPRRPRPDGGGGGRHHARTRDPAGPRGRHDTDHEADRAGLLAREVPAACSRGAAPALAPGGLGGGCRRPRCRAGVGRVFQPSAGRARGRGRGRPGHRGAGGQQAGGGTAGDTPGPGRRRGRRRPGEASWPPWRTSRSSAPGRAPW